MEGAGAHLVAHEDLCALERASRTTRPSIDADDAHELERVAQARDDVFVALEEFG